MTSVLTLIANPCSRDLDDSMIEAARDALGVDDGQVTRLAPRIACDITFSHGDIADAEASLGERLNGAAVDMIVQPAHERRKTLLVADMESTVIANEFVDELAALAGVGERVAAITARTIAGEIDFAAALTMRVAMLAGLSVSALDQVYDNLTVMPGARALIATMTAHGAHTALVSGGFTCFTGRVSAALGFNSHSANVLEVAAHHLTGKLIPPIIDRAGKRNRLDALCSDLGMTREQTMSVGDGANDIDMLQAAGMGVAYRAKPAAAKAARARINHGDLTALLYIQGYHARDFSGV
ncbi:MAG: phosphoserine phosphatase SerB [Alphaproteobacteria bacterium]|jgi:phosphoserine phosphatase